MRKSAFLVIFMILFFGCASQRYQYISEGSPVNSTKTQSSPTKNATSSTDKSGNNGKHEMRGEASWYGPGYHGRTTANGEKFNQNAMTAAHKTLAFNTKIKVTDLQTGKSVIVRINDRGPYAKGRIIDLSKGAAEKLGIKEKGHAEVKLEFVK